MTLRLSPKIAVLSLFHSGKNSIENALTNPYSNADTPILCEYQLQVKTGLHAEHETYEMIKKENTRAKSAVYVHTYFGAFLMDAEDANLRHLSSF